MGRMTTRQDPSPDPLEMLTRLHAATGSAHRRRDAALAPGGAADQGCVPTGSRQGNAVLRAQGYYGRDAGMASRYVEDDGGITVREALGAWMRARAFGETKASAMTAAALAAFTQFETAFAVGTQTREGLTHTDG
ncbi:hypothetical protein MTR62_15045 [Novosphingobium sp. 1949]|uniref:Uncharacterized protein n=2 Tax=Novosphingobium organovorum TaxID=2930092 RepID=A0ABT0BG02_9SPHN|nr:hypothetical protein [Novosphingobium organovorum]